MLGLQYLFLWTSLCSSECNFVHLNINIYEIQICIWNVDCLDSSFFDNVNQVIDFGPINLNNGLQKCTFTELCTILKEQRVCVCVWLCGCVSVCLRPHTRKAWLNRGICNPSTCSCITIFWGQVGSFPRIYHISVTLRLFLSVSIHVNWSSPIVLSVVKYVRGCVGEMSLILPPHPTPLSSEEHIDLNHCTWQALYNNIQL